MFPKKTSKRKYRYGLYKCPNCPKEFRTLTHAVKNGSSAQCKSCANKVKTLKHGGKYTRLYSIWVGMKNRCNNSNSEDYERYGKKGIKVCFDWTVSFERFRDWALNNGYSDDLTIDRRNNNTGYRPQNCRWANGNTQQQNKTVIQKNNTSGHKGAVWIKRDKVWEARIKINGKSNYLGRFNSAKEAGIAYNKYVIVNNLEHTLNEIKGLL